MFRRRVVHQLSSAMASLRFLTVTPIPMPALSPTMEKGKITEWVKKVGDPVTSGDTWCKVETDKAVVSYDNATEEGFLARILVQVGEEAVVGDTVCLLVDEAEGVNSDEVKNWAAAADANNTNTTTTTNTTTPAATTTAASSSAGGHVKASPLARKTAKELNVSLEGIKGTGGGVGRIVKKDVEAAAAAGTAQKGSTTTTTAAAAAKPAPAATTAAAAAKPKPQTPAAAPKPSAPVNDNYTDIPVTNMRATIAKRLTQSKNVEIPHYYLFEECCVDNMMALVHQLNAKGDGKYKITLNDYIIKAVARANMLVPDANSSWQGSVVRRYNTVDVSVAVATPTGLITPIIKNAQARGLADISNEMKALAKKAREGTLQPNEFMGGTVSVSNLGASGIPGFTAIINPPQSLILAVGSAKPRAKITMNAETGKYEVSGEVEMVMKFTASFDHRVIDGAVGAEWCKHFKDAIENPLSLML
ncbi:dihydrolipoamide acetyltransferase precursor [Trypanosoma theileri]|uniref:Dihydrolipoamide acetyltransferase component of pyruvate dehydrogenase complex n=1 Tax=Trypanosoma theileri TaxID=67003 RepID=A0A1X0NKN9_9TRYP|nr:dihydrolipoamide acetyltransferase precursor [Trypanosoma theileri]ORC85227.1 dihydrolipoamide acetyltransferase precursor [Trypanosoma theileri]